MTRAGRALLAGLLLLTGLVWLPTAAAQDIPQLSISVARLEPRAPRPGQAFEVVGRVVNTSQVPVDGLQVRLALGPLLTLRSQLTSADTDRPATGTLAHRALLGTQLAPEPVTLAPGQAIGFDLRTTVDALGLGGAPGVYPLDVVAGSSGITRLAVAPTWLPWFGGTQREVRPTRVAVVWPLVDTPVQTAAGELRDDHLATSLSDRGRLGSLLAAGRAGEKAACDSPAVGPNGTRDPVQTDCTAAPVSYVVDPDLVDTAQRMTGPYRAAGAAGRGAAAASSWLTSLRAAAQTSPLLAVPYADPDVSALAQTSAGGLDIVHAQLLGADVLRTDLGAAADTTVDVPPEGPVTQAAYDLAPSGTQAVLLTPGAFAAVDAPVRTPEAQTTIRSTASVTGLVTDDALSRLLTGDSAVTLGPRLAEQRWLAETALLADEAPSLSRTIVLSPPRRGTVVAGAAGAMLQDLGRVPWLCPVTVTAVARGDESCPGDRGRTSEVVDRGELLPPAPGLSRAALAHVDADRDRATQITDAVLSPERGPSAQSALQRAVARAESDAWATDPKGRAAAVRALDTETAQLVRAVDINAQNLTLTSDDGTLSVSVENNDAGPVQAGVVFSSSRAGLLLPTSARFVSPSVEIPARTARPASVRARSATTGRYEVVAQLVDRNGKPFGPRRTIFVRSTQYGQLALGITGAAALVLLLASGVRLVRRARARR